MEHSFDIDIAKEYGIPAAILLKHIYYWVEKNRTNDKHYKDGCYWTYNSMKSFDKLFPYMSESTIKRSIKKLVDSELIVEAVYNDMPFDRTKWYTLTQLGYELVRNEIANICDIPLGQNDQSHLVNLTQSDEVKMAQPIPYKYKYKTQINNKSSKEDYICHSGSDKAEKAKTVYPDVVELWNTLSAYGIKPIRSITAESKRHVSLRARFKQYGEESFAEIVEKIKESDFLQGKTYSRKPFVVYFDWVILPSNYPKVLEGNYDNRTEPKEEKSNGFEFSTGLEKPKKVWQ